MAKKVEELPVPKFDSELAPPELTDEERAAVEAEAKKRAKE